MQIIIFSDVVNGAIDYHWARQEVKEHPSWLLYPINAVRLFVTVIVSYAFAAFVEQPTFSLLLKAFDRAHRKLQ